MDREGQLHFKTNVQLKSIIGKDLINDDNIAILELVKNSFDADAKKVTIEFANIKSNDDLTIKKGFSNNTSKIIIKDNGLGMSLNDIDDKWLNIAYSEKKINNRQHNRLMAGAKGIGRFSCDRLGEYLNIYSKIKEKNEYIKLEIDWKKFELDNAQNKEIQSILLDYKTLSKEDLKKEQIKPFDNGVVLEIIKLRKNWSKQVLDANGNLKHWDINNFSVLKKYLEKLINPNQAYENNDFGVYIEAEEFDAENKKLLINDRFLGKIENKIFDKLNFKATTIISEIVDDGENIYTELKDKGKTIFWLKEKNEFKTWIKNGKITLYYLNPYAKAFFTKQMGFRATEYGSVFLFINGFRVPPYGERRDDWLALDQRKAQGHSRFIGNRDLVGRIEVLDNHNQFRIISSREGVVKSESFFKLTNQKDGYFYKTFKRLEKYVTKGLAWDSIPLNLQRNFADIEEKIISGEAIEEELIYRETSKVKRKRIYGLIHSIISAKGNDVIELYINEELILDKVEEEKKVSQKEFASLMKNIEEKKVDSSFLSEYLKKYQFTLKNAEKEKKEFLKYPTAPETSDAIKNLNDYNKTLAEQARIIRALKKQLELAEKQVENAEKEIENAELKTDTILRQLSEIKSQNLFLKSYKSQELDEVVSFLHHIGISANNVENEIGGAYQQLTRNQKLSPDEIKSIFEYTSLEINKILTISRFATKANFKLFTEEKETDLIQYIVEYLGNIVRPIRSENVNITIENNPEDNFVHSFKPIEISIIIDNLISNSIKAKAQNINIALRVNENEFEMLFEDDGLGVKSNMSDILFEIGATTTIGGSGLGLFHVKKMLVDIGGNIELVKNKPATFRITLKK